MKQLIYLHTCIITDKSYTGQTIRTMEVRLKEHINNSEKGGNSHFERALRKYGIENFTSEVLEDNIPVQSDLISKQTLADQREKHFIEKYDTFNNGYNMTIGGGGSLGIITSSATKEKMSESHKGMKHTNITKQKIGKIHKGKITSDETKRKIRNSKKGTIYSEVSKKNMGDSRRGIKRGTYIELVCPHCGFIGNGGVMKRWHFDRCKLNLN